MVIPFNPEGRGIGELLILFSENFEGMGREWGIRKNVARARKFFLWNRYRVGEAVCVKKSRFFWVFKSLQNERFFLENNDEQ